MDAIFHLDHRTKPKLGGSRCSGARIVGLNRSRDQDGVGTFFKRSAKVEFKLPNLVAAKSKSGQIIPFDRQINTKLL